MTPEVFLRTAVTPALSLLPERMDSPEARAMLVAIALQESRLEHRRQIGGPAHSFVQFEPVGIRGVLTHPRTSDLAFDVCEALSIEADVPSVYVAIEFHDVLCAAFARLLLWTLPYRLPFRAEPSYGWTQYVAAWRPGMPRRESWEAWYDEAWQTVAPKVVKEYRA